MSSCSDSHPRGQHGSRNNPSQTCGQQCPITAANEFSTCSLPLFEPIPYIGPPPSSDIPGTFPHLASGASLQLELMSTIPMWQVEGCIRDDISETGQKLWKDTIHEVLLQALAMIPGERLSPTKGIECLLMRTLTLFCADLASKATPYVRQFLPNHKPTSNSDKDDHYLKQKDEKCAHITNTSNISNFFMHEHDKELFYTIKHESKCVNEALPRIPFMGMELSPTFEAYYIPFSMLCNMQSSVRG
ncbi:hypothetical protein EDC04DRAFT_2616094 [Pisolithus marmoratus]|nr:hypothetical protein EDC04DRAFT_2616094 [Pisolithus marmoratus]